MKHVLLTGYTGKIGTVLSEGLKDCKLKLVGRPEVDLTHYDSTHDATKDIDTIVHMAWDSFENRRTGMISVKNELMTFNILKCAVENKVKKIIMASSVHADDFYNWNMSSGLMTTHTIPTPTSPYGASKIFMEALSRHYVKEGIEIICIRFGGVNSTNTPPLHDEFETKVWLSHADCISLVRTCINTSPVAGRYSCFYAVSNNTARIHDVSNPFGWEPKDNALS